MTESSKISNFLAEARKALEEAQKDIASTDVEDALYTYTNQAQELLNALLSKTGIITDQEINELDEQLRKAKREIELSKAEQTKRKFYITTAIVVAAFVGLWLITKKK